MHLQIFFFSEMCVTSNVVCGTSKSYLDHHIQEWIKNDLPFCICVSIFRSMVSASSGLHYLYVLIHLIIHFQTDDKGVFCTTLSNEYKIVQENFKLNTKQILEISNTSINLSFASKEEKVQLHRKQNQWMYSKKLVESKIVS